MIRKEEDSDRIRKTSDRKTQEKDPRLRLDNDFDFTDRSGSSSLRFSKIGCKGLSELTARALPKMSPTVFVACVKISSDFAFRETG